MALSNNVERGYIGMTKRKFIERIKEHHKTNNYYKRNTVLSQFYLYNKGFNMNFNKVKIIVLYNNLYESKNRKSIEIIAPENKPCIDILSYYISKIMYNTIFLNVH